MSKRECTVLDSALSPPLKVLEEWPGSMSNMAPASSFREQEQPIHGSEAMQSGRAADPSEERFMTPPERRSRRSSPEEGNEDSEKQGHGIHPLSYGVQQPAVSRALVFESLDSPDEDVTLLGSSADMAPHQHAPPASDEDDVMAPVNAGMEEDDDDVAIVEEAPRSRGQGRPGRSGQQRRAGHGADVGVFAEEGEEDARAGEGDLQSQEDADLALAKAMQEQECAFMLLAQQQQYAYSSSPGLSLPGSSSSQRLMSRENSGSSRGHRSMSGGFSQAMDRLSVYPQDAAGPAGGSQPLHQGQRHGEVQRLQGSGSEDSAIEDPLQAFGDAPGVPGQEDGGGGGEGEEMSDEEFARRLQEEEERQMAARLMAMAGVGARPLIQPRGRASAGAVGVPAAARDWALHGRQGGRGGPEGEGEGALEEDDEEEDAEFEDGEGDEYGFFADGAYEGDALDVDNMSYEELTALGEAIGTEAKGLAPHVIASLPRMTFLASDHHKAEGEAAEGDDEICAICRCEFEDGDALSLLVPCKHSYHVDCIAEWLKLNKVCPICKSEVRLESGSKASRPRDRR